MSANADHELDDDDFVGIGVDFGGVASTESELSSWYGIDAVFQLVGTTEGNEQLTEVA